jgi:hypothetical protein
MKSQLLFLGLIAALAVAPLPAQLFQQTLPPNLATAEGNDQTADPFQAGGTQRWQWVFDSSLMSVQAPIIIRDLSVRCDLGSGSGAFNFPSLAISMGSATANYDALSSSNLSGNIGANGFQWRPPIPLSGAGSVGTSCGTGGWVKILQGAFFVFDPRLGQDLVIQVDLCGATTPFASVLDAQTGSLARRYGNTTDCLGNTANISDDRVPVLLLEFATSEEWETNDAFSSLRINGKNNTPINPLKLTTCADSVNVLQLDSNLPNGWELAISFSPGTAASANGFRSSAGQIINIELGQPLIFFNALNFPPFPGPISFLVSLPAPMTFSSQMLVLDPSFSDGSRLSALAEFDVVPGLAPPASPVAGPTADDANTPINIGCFSFFGKLYSDIQVTSNGRITFGSVNTQGAPTLASPVCLQPPQIGYWADLDPSLGGAITLTATGPRSVRVDYSAVPYSGFPLGPTNTFSIAINGITGTVTVDGISGIAPHPAPGSALGLLGISGGVGVITDPGPTVFQVGGPFFPQNATDAIYALGAPGLLSSGVQRISFTPIRSGALAGNYSWVVQ